MRKRRDYVNQNVEAGGLDLHKVSILDCSHTPQPCLCWGVNSIVAGIHQLDEPPRLHSGGRKLSVYQGQGLQIQGVTLIRYGRLNSPRV
jgi:hypothetical protein